MLHRGCAKSGVSPEPIVLTCEIRAESEQEALTTLRNSWEQSDDVTRPLCHADIVLFAFDPVTPPLPSDSAFSSSTRPDVLDQ